jgi:hypothetical protein
VKTKIKKGFYSMIALFIALPMIVQAQVKTAEELSEKTNLKVSTVDQIIERVMLWLLGIVGIVGVIAFAIAGLLYLTSAGNENQIEKAKKAMLYAIIGVVVSLGGLVVVKTIEMLLSP